MKTEELVGNLVHDLRPTRHVTWRMKAAFWIMVSSLYLVVVAYFFGFRLDLSKKIYEASFAIPLLALASLAVGSAIVFTFLSVPRLEITRVQKSVPWIIVWLWVVYLGMSLSSSGGLHFHGFLHPISWTCARDLLLFGAVPFFVAWALVKSGAPTQPRMASFHSLMASGALGAIGVQLICANDSPSHLLAWHVLPLIVIVMLFRKLVATTFRWA